MVLALAGVAFLAWFIASPLGPPDGDEAVVGLMARGMLHGHFQAFFWGQNYGGTQESGLLALLLALRVPGRWAIEAVPIGLHLAAAVLVWRVGLRTVGPRAALLAAAIFWGASAPMLWWATKERGFYGVTLVAGLAVVLFALRLADRLFPRIGGAAAPPMRGKRWWTRSCSGGSVGSGGGLVRKRCT